MDIKPEVASHITFKGKMVTKDFYGVMERIDVIKQMGYTFIKHDRKDHPTFIEFNYELELTNLNKFF